MLLNIVLDLVPVFMSTMAVALFTSRTRYLSYTVVILSIISELMALHINMTALYATIFCLIGIFLLEIFHILKSTQPYYTFIPSEK